MPGSVELELGGAATGGMPPPPVPSAGAIRKTAPKGAARPAVAKPAPAKGEWIQCGGCEQERLKHIRHQNVPFCHPCWNAARRIHDSMRESGTPSDVKADKELMAMDIGAWRQKHADMGFGIGSEEPDEASARGQTRPAAAAGECDVSWEVYETTEEGFEAWEFVRRKFKEFPDGDADEFMAEFDLLLDEQRASNAYETQVSPAGHDMVWLPVRPRLRRGSGVHTSTSTAKPGSCSMGGPPSPGTPVFEGHSPSERGGSPPPGKRAKLTTAQVQKHNADVAARVGHAVRQPGVARTAVGGCAASVGAGTARSGAAGRSQRLLWASAAAEEEGGETGAQFVKKRGELVGKIKFLHDEIASPPNGMIQKVNRQIKHAQTKTVDCSTLPMTLESVKERAESMNTKLSTLLTEAGAASSTTLEASQTSYEQAHKDFKILLRDFRGSRDAHRIHCTNVLRQRQSEKMCLDWHVKRLKQDFVKKGWLDFFASRLSDDIFEVEDALQSAAADSEFKLSQNVLSITAVPDTTFPLEEVPKVPLLFKSDLLGSRLPIENDAIKTAADALDTSLKAARWNVPGGIAAVELDTPSLLEGVFKGEVAGGEGSAPWLSTHRVNFMRTSPIDLPLMGLAAIHFNLGPHTVYYVLLPFQPMLKRGVVYEEITEHMQTKSFETRVEKERKVIKCDPGHSVWLPTGWLCWCTHAVFPKKPAEVQAERADPSSNADASSLPDTWAHTLVIPTAVASDIADVDQRVFDACVTLNHDVCEQKKPKSDIWTARFAYLKASWKK